MSDNDLKVVVYGAGAVGCSVYSWIAQHYDNIHLLSRGNSLKQFRTSKTMTLYLKSEEDNKIKVPVKIIGDLTEITAPDIVIITVKNYNLEEVAKDIKLKLQKEPIIVGLQNGVKNQEILPKYFSNIIYGVVSYNVWRDKPDLIGYSTKGPITLGILKDTGDLRSMLEKIVKIFNLGLETEISDTIEDVIYNKMVINLANSLNTLAGHNKRNLTNAIPLLKKILLNLFWEGIQVITAAGYKEQKMRWMPAWDGLKVAAMNPDVFPDDAYAKNMENLGFNSMAQDIYVAKRNQTEIESLNGKFLKMAEKVGVKIPYIKAIYNLAKNHFSKDFQPLEVEEIWNAIKKEIG